MNRLLAELRKRIPQFTTLPFVVYKATWETTTGDDTAPDVAEWNSVVNGLSPDKVTHAVGWEEHNQTTWGDGKGSRVEPKMYLFDPSDEGTVL